MDKVYNVASLGYAKLSPNCQYKSMEERKIAYEESIKDPVAYWDKLAARLLDWFVPYKEVFSGGFEKGDIAWFSDGKLNASFNCLDRHARRTPDKIAIIHEANEPGNATKYTYKEVLEEVCRMANVLKRFGVRKGDCIAIYMPMIPQAAFAMLACARLGAPHSVIFAGFSKDAIRDRVLDAGCQYLICADKGYRGKKVIDLKTIVDDGLATCRDVKNVFMWQREEIEMKLIDERDVILNEEVLKERPYCPCEVMDSEDPLFMLYTSGSTGKPKGVVHTTAGYMLYTMHTVQTVFDLQPNDIFACVADVGWITGHSYIVYGPLAAGTTTLMFESIPTYPNVSRYWAMIEEHKVTQFYTAPTAIRALSKHGPEPVKKHDLSTCRVLGTVGEPINPEAWNWYHTVVGKEKCTIVDTYWQTETGGHMLTPIPGCTNLKAGSATLPFFGVEFALLDGKTGDEIRGNDKEGILCVKKPWPSIARTVYANHQRYLNTYMNPYKGYYFTGDGARRDKDGLYWITGRVDDVVNVSGHRLGTAEIEACLATHPEVAEAACVGIPDDIKGMTIFAYCVPSTKSVKPDFPKTLNQLVRSSIGAFAAPKNILIVPEVPKTRSGKVMRRLLRKIGTQEYAALGDVTTLSNAEAVEEIIRLRKAMK